MKLIKNHKRLNIIDKSILLNGNNKTDNSDDLSDFRKPALKSKPERKLDIKAKVVYYPL